MPANHQFRSCECGAPSITIPTAIVDDAAVRCGGCHRIIGTWIGYKSFVSRSIRREIQSVANAPLVCVDPIMTQPLAEPRAAF